MDLELLEDYLAVLEHGSILAAAEATGASQPTLSRRIRELEDALRYNVSVSPQTDLNDEAFALFSQALQLPLQAVYTLRIRYPVGMQAVFMPMATASAPRANCGA